jgi:hypothetical protein
VHLFVSPNGQPAKLAKYMYSTLLAVSLFGCVVYASVCPPRMRSNAVWGGGGYYTVALRGKVSYDASTGSATGALYSQSIKPSYRI